MSKLRATLQLAVSEDEAAAASRRALVQMGWSLLEERPLRIVAREDATRLHCHCSPATVTLAFAPRSGGSVIEIETEVPGFGPISSQHAEEQSQVLARRIIGVQRGKRPVDSAP